MAFRERLQAAELKFWSLFGDGVCSCKGCGMPTHYMKIEKDWYYCEVCWANIIPSYGEGEPTLFGVPLSKQAEFVENYYGEV